MLVGLPDGVKPIKCKWDYKKKIEIERKVETFKTRLVVKWYTQKEGINYEETFSLVAMIKSICILLFIFATLNYKIWQLNIKTTFLNENLDESIYMVQPEGFVEKS